MILQQQRQDEDRDVLNFRHELAVARAAKDKQDATDARNIMFNNGLIAQEERRMDLLMEKARQDEDRDILTFRREVAQAGAAKKKDDARIARESLQERLDAWRAEKAFDENLVVQNAEIERDLLASRRQDLIDVAEDKKAQANFRRDSLAARLAEWRRQKSLAVVAENEKTEVEVN